MRHKFAILLALFSCEAHAQEAEWRAAKVGPAWSVTADKAVALFGRTHGRYDVISAARDNGVPATVLFVLHMRESDNDFKCSAAQGDPLTHRSINVPRGRLPNKQPPYTWEECAIDAYYVCDRLDAKDWQTVNGSLTAIESFNGMGYRKLGIPSPYVWSGTNQYRSGKFTGDHRFSSGAIDKQIGCAAVLLRMRERGVQIPPALASFVKP